MRAEDIRLFPDPILRQKCLPVTAFDSNLRGMVTLLKKVLKQQSHGIGIAAPQIGLPIRLAIVDASKRDPVCSELILVNPKILRYEEEHRSREGCMSLPDYTAELKRYTRIQIQWQDETGTVHCKDSVGIEAVCLQHEIDHLNGKLFLDRVVCFKTDMIPREHRKLKIV